MCVCGEIFLVGKQVNNHCINVYKYISLTPRGLPQFRVKGGKGQANFGVRFKAPRRRQKDNMRRFKWIFGRQEDAAVINTTGKIGIGGSSNGAVVTKKE